MDNPANILINALATSRKDVGTRSKHGTAIYLVLGGGSHCAYASNSLAMRTYTGFNTWRASILGGPRKHDRSMNPRPPSIHNECCKTSKPVYPANDVEPYAGGAGNGLRAIYKQHILIAHNHPSLGNGFLRQALQEIVSLQL